MIPERTMRALQAWTQRGELAGGFLDAVITNDLARAVAAADAENLAALPKIMAWLYNEAPPTAWRWNLADDRLEVLRRVVEGHRAHLRRLDEQRRHPGRAQHTKDPHAI